MLFIFSLDTAIAAGVPGGGVDRREETFTPTGGQTAFSISATPVDPSDVDFYVNEVKYTQPTFYTVSGTVVTWLDNEFTLDGDDVVEIIYFV